MSTTNLQLDWIKIVDAVDAVDAERAQAERDAQERAAQAERNAQALAEAVVGTLPREAADARRKGLEWIAALTWTPGGTGNTAADAPVRERAAGLVGAVLIAARVTHKVDNVAPPREFEGAPQRALLVSVGDLINVARAHARAAQSGRLRDERNAGEPCAATGPREGVAPRAGVGDALDAARPDGGWVGAVGDGGMVTRPPALDAEGDRLVGGARGGAR